MYATDPLGRVVYYYAHLDAYQPGLAEGATIARGDVLGIVGTTGNAPKDTPHLHFQVMRMPADGKYWDGEAINPYPALPPHARRTPMTLSSKERAALRAEAHHLTALVHVGHHGLTDALRQTLDDALRTHELVKVALSEVDRRLGEGRGAPAGRAARCRRGADDRPHLHALPGEP